MSQAQNQAQTIPPHVIEFLKEIGFDVTRARKCVDRDFVAVLSAILLADGERFDYNIYRVADNWCVLHIWMPDVGSDMALIANIAKFENDYMLEECFMVEEE